MEFHEVPVEVCVDVGVDGAVNLFALLEQTAQRFPDRGAVYHGEHRCCTWSQLRDRSLRLAGSLRQGCPAGARIAIISENRPELVELLFGIWAAHLVAVPINYKLHPREMVHILEDADVSHVFTSAAIAAELGSDCGFPIESLEAEAYSYRLTAPPATVPDTDPSALAWLFYTSGTTGRAKGAMLSHRNLIAMTVAHLADIDAPDEGCSLVHVAPMSHGSGLYIPAYVLRGARQVVPQRGGFDPGEFLDLCEQHPGCSAFLAPTMVQRVVDTARATSRGCPSQPRTIIYGGGPMYVDSIKKALAVFGSVFAQIYGQGESPMTITGLRRADHVLADDAILGSVGYPRSGMEVAVLRDDGAPAGVGEIGEIVCRGDVVMSGYWRNRAATDATLCDGWLRTGDLGSFDARGYLTLHDRSKDVVISGGTNIYPREVEEALLEHPGVSEACVVGAPDPEWGEIVIAFIVGAAEPDALDAHLVQRIARFKRPKRYLTVEQLPKNSYGKVLKRELRQQLW